MSEAAPEVLDLDAKRAQRARLRAAQQEGRGATLPIRFGGQQIAELAAELPLDVLAPLKDINLDLALLVRKGLDLVNAEDGDMRAATMDTIVSVLAANPELPQEVLAAVAAMGARLLGEEGYAAFVAQRPTREDVAELITELLRWYGVSLGESSESLPPPTDGQTSRAISNGVTDSTPEPSGDAPAPPGSSVSADSPT